MSDDRQIRLENMRRVCRERRLGPHQLSEGLGSRYSYWRDLLAGQKSFGEKIARRVEEGLELPRGWLDNQHASQGETEKQRFERAFMAVAKALMPREQYEGILRCTEGIVRPATAEIVPQVAERVGFEPTVR